MWRMAETDVKLCSQTETLLIRIVNCCLIGTWWKKNQATHRRWMRTVPEPTKQNWQHIVFFCFSSFYFTSNALLFDIADAAAASWWLLLFLLLLPNALHAHSLYFPLKNQLAKAFTWTRRLQRKLQSKQQQLRQRNEYIREIYPSKWFQKEKNRPVVRERIILADTMVFIEVFQARRWRDGDCCVYKRRQSKTFLTFIFSAKAANFIFFLFVNATDVCPFAAGDTAAVAQLVFSSTSKFVHVCRLSEFNCSNFSTGPNPSRSRWKSS